VVTYKRPATITQNLRNYTYLVFRKTKKRLEGVWRPCQHCARFTYHGKHSKSAVTCVSQIMTKRKTYPLKRNLTFANYGVYVATCIVVRYAINTMLAK